MAADETRAPADIAVTFRRETLRLKRDVAKARFGGRLVLRTPLSCDFTIQNGVTSEASSSIGSPYHIFSLCGISSAYLRRQRSAEKLFECPTVFIRLYSNGQMTL